MLYELSYSVLTKMLHELCTTSLLMAVLVFVMVVVMVVVVVVVTVVVIETVVVAVNNFQWRSGNTVMGK